MCDHFMTKHLAPKMSSYAAETAWDGQDLREGSGSYFYAESGKVFVGEWVNDLPKAPGVRNSLVPTNVQINIPKLSKIY